MRYEFRWIAWNVDHIARHGISIHEAQNVVNAARPPFPEYRGDDRWLAIGRGEQGRFIQVVYLIDDDGTLFVIHARPLKEGEIRRYRRRVK